MGGTDDFAGRVSAKRVDPRATLSALAETLDDGGLPDREVVANLESEIRNVYEMGGRRFPSDACAYRDSSLGGTQSGVHPQLPRNPAEMRVELTSAEIAMIGFYLITCCAIRAALRL